MFIPPHNELAPPPLQRPERRPGQSATGSTTPVTASLVPTERQSVNGLEVLHANSALASNYPNMPHARIYHPKQAPSAISSENFLTARAALNPGFSAARAVRKFSDDIADGACSVSYTHLTLPTILLV